MRLFKDRVLSFDTDAARHYAELDVTAKVAERRFPTLDGYIAAIAASRSFIVASRDTAPCVAAATIKVQPEREFRVPVRWTEGDSLTTEENALFSAKILAGARVHKILLGTHALHMPRAQRLFSDTGLEVIPAPTDFSSAVSLRWINF